jgi:pimeloyl-ACP methyl ester carboxylesterase
MTAPFRVVLLATVASALLFPFSGEASVQDTSRVPLPPSAPGRLVDIGGWRLHLNCVGETKPGQPTIVLEAGAGDLSVTWALVQPKVATFARVCSYDRAGSGWSDLGPSPRTMRQIVYELHTVLNRGGIAPPYLLVGHSLGGFLARLFTSTYPAEVAGVVLVDASHEDDLVFFINERQIPQMQRWWESATGKPVPPVKTSEPMHEAEVPVNLQEQIQASIQQNVPRVNNPPFDKLPVSSQQARTWAFSQLKSYLPGNSEFNGDEVAAIRTDRQKAEHPLGDRPLIVLTRGLPVNNGPQAAQREEERRAHQADLVALSRNGKQVVAEGSRHEIQLDAPDAVVQAIRDVLDVTAKR